MTDGTFVDELERIAQEAAEPAELERGNVYAFRLGAKVEVVDLTGDQYRDTPARKVGTVRVRDVASFATYWGKHHQPGRSEVYADRDARTVTAVIDAHGDEADATGWAQHRLVLGLTFSPALTAWLERDGRHMSQEQFAEFLDDQRADIREPSAAEMLEIAQTIQGTQRVDWRAGHRLVDGQRRIGFTETNEAKAGTKGELAIPVSIVIGVQIFDGSEVAHALSARFRHRIEGGQLRLMYKLDRPADVVTAAFNGVVDEVAEATGATVLRGAPA